MSAALCLPVCLRVRRSVPWPGPPTGTCLYMVTLYPPASANANTSSAPPPGPPPTYHLLYAPLPPGFPRRHPLFQLPRLPPLFSNWDHPTSYLPRLLLITLASMDHTDRPAEWVHYVALHTLYHDTCTDPFSRSFQCLFSLHPCLCLFPCHPPPPPSPLWGGGLGDGPPPSFGGCLAGGSAPGLRPAGALGLPGLDGDFWDGQCGAL